MDVLNGKYPSDILTGKRFMNAVAADAPTCQDGYHWNGTQCVSDTATTTTPVTYNCPELQGQPCDSVLTSDPECYGSTYSATGDLRPKPKYRNVGEVALIATALAGIGSAVGSIFGAKTAALEAENAQSQLEYDLLMEQEKRKTTLNIIIGVVGLIAIGVGAYAVIRYVKKGKR